MFSVTRSALLALTTGVSIAFASAAHAAIVSVTGSGAFSTVGDSVNGVFDLGTETVDYTLTLNNISGIGRVEWNGENGSPISPDPGFSFGAGIPSLTDTWTVTFNFSQAVSTDWFQGNPSRGTQNQGASQFSLNAIGSSVIPVILDPDDQLRNESTSPGMATFRISDNPGGGSTAFGGTVSISNASWQIIGVSSSQIQLTWTAQGTTQTSRESIAIDGSTFATSDSTAVPEPLTVLGSLVALGGGIVLKLRQKS